MEEVNEEIDDDMLMAAAHQDEDLDTVEIEEGIDSRNMSAYNHLDHTK